MAPELPLLWMAPFLTGGGYSSEALSFALGLQNATSAARADPSAVRISFGVRQFAEQPNEAYIEGLPRATVRTLQYLLDAGEPPGAAAGVVVCHSTPDAWVPSKYPGWDELAPCPPPGAGVKVRDAPRYRPKATGRCSLFAPAQNWAAWVNPICIGIYIYVYIYI